MPLWQREKIQELLRKERVNTKGCCISKLQQPFFESCQIMFEQIGQLLFQQRNIFCDRLPHQL